MRRIATFAERFREPYWLVCGLMLLVSLPGRFASLGQSLWLDEAWVANSLLAPTLRETLYFDRWLQSTPPLFLAIARAAISFTGYSEPALRIVPLLAALSSLVILAVVLRRLFSPPVAWLSFAVVLSNYWVTKYGQQVEQYGTDLLVACLFIVLLERIVQGKGGRTDYVRLGLLGCVSTFLSFTSVFFLASCVIAVSLPNPAPGGVSGVHTGGLRYRRLLGWNPNHVYFGNTDWPCCALNKEKRTSSPDARDLLEDVNRAAARAGNHTLWLLLPSAAPGHWSRGLAPRIDAIPQALGQWGCQQRHKRLFGQTLVLAFSCP